MFEGLINELTLATMADYDRLVNRLRLEGEARSAAADQTERDNQARHHHFPWVSLRRHTSQPA